MSNFEVVSRRGEAKVEAPPKIQEVEVANAEGGWKDVRFVHVLAGVPNGQLLIIGRVVGIRNDDSFFIADYLLPSEVKKDFLWQAEAKKRLDTFEHCACKSGSTCATHNVYLAQWGQQDMERIALTESAPKPPAIERLERVEAARRAAKRSNIEVPQRG